MTRYFRLAVPVLGMLLSLWACSGSTSLTADAGFSVGTDCTRTSDCSPGLVCYRTEDLDGGATGKNFLPDGYCTRSCVEDVDCKGDACIQGYCMKACGSDDDCGRDGYKCWEGRVCVASFDIGKSCGSSDDCGNGMECASSDPFPDGYCAFSCDTPRDCPVFGGAVCTDPSGGDLKYCLMKCVTDDECRTGERYGCRMVHVDTDIDGYPMDFNVCAGADNVGASCKADGDCSKGLTCPSANETKLTEQVCTKPCARDAECPASSTCATGEADGAAPTCSADADCGAGFACRDLNNGFKGCTCAADGDCKGGFQCLDYGNDKVCMCAADDACAAGFACMDVGQGFATCAKGFCSRACRRDENCGKAGYACRYKATDSETNDDLQYCTDTNNVGAACGGNDDCTQGLGMQCLTEDDDPVFPGGFCTATCSDDSDCRAFGMRWCYKGNCQRSCDDRNGRGWDFICARKHYTCHKRDADQGYVCLGSANYGASCRGDTECTEGLTCREGNAFPGGYCTAQCESDDDCPGSGFGICQNGYCSRACESTADCGRYGYACLEGDGSSKYCSIPPNVGAECQAYESEWKADCTEGLYCNTDAAWPNGYCTRDCNADDDCPAGSDGACFDGICLRQCGRDDDCWRTGYTCHAKSRKVDNADDERLVCLGVHNTGAACEVDEDCTSDEQFALTCQTGGGADSKWRGKSCTTACGADSDCPDSPEFSLCGGAGSEKTCIRTCRSDAECGRSHYFCLRSSGDLICTANPNVGQTCSIGADCYSGLECLDLAGGLKACSKACDTDGDCISESHGKCTGDTAKTCVRGCGADIDCGRPGELFCKGDVCAVIPNYGAGCGSDTDCYGGLGCKDVGGGTKICSASCGNDDDCAPNSNALCDDTWCMRACRSDDDCAASAFECDTGNGRCKLK